MRNPNLASIKQTAFKKDVYEPAEDSFLLADTILSDLSTWDHKPRIFLEIGSGSGYVVCSVARALKSLGGSWCQSLATDIHGSACQATLETLKNHEIDTSVDIINCDLLDPLAERMEHMVDLVAFNPPYVVTPDEEVTHRGISAAWAGGYKGRRVIDRVFPLLDRIMSDGGIVYMIAIHDNNPQEIIDEMHKFSFEGSILAKQSADEELLYVLKFVKKQST